MTRTRTWPTVLPFVGLALAGLILGGYLFCGEDDDPDEPAAAARRPSTVAGARARPGGAPKLRVPKLVPGPASRAAPVSGRADPNAPARVRLAPLLALYGEFEEDTELGVTTLREVRRILHRTQESLLRSERLAKENLAEPASSPARRQRALSDLARELRAQLPDEEVDRVLAHPFPQELMGWDEPLFEATPRGIVNLRKDLQP